MFLIWLISPGFSETLEQLRTQLRGTDLDAKSNALYELEKISESDPAAKQILIDQLKEEIALEKKRIKEGRFHTGEAKGELFAHLLSVVANFRDISTLNILMDSMQTGTSVKSVYDTFVHFADTSTLSILRKLEDPKFSEYGKSEAVDILVLIAQSEKFNEETRQVLRKTFFDLLKDSSWDIRKGAVCGLGAIGNTDDIKIIRELTENDPYSIQIAASFRGGKKGEKKKIYLVREASEKAIKLIQERQKIQDEKKMLKKSTTTQ